MILDVLVAAVILSIVFKRIKNIFQREYKLLYLIPLIFVIQFIPFHKEILIPISFALMILFIFKNRGIPGFKWMGIGILMNGFIMTINGGKMPVLRELADRMGLHIGNRHIPITEWNWKIILGDWIPVHLPYGRQFIISPGDILVYIGVFLFFLSPRSDHLPRT